MNVNVSVRTNVDFGPAPERSRQEAGWLDRLVESLRRRAVLSQFSADQVAAISRGSGGRC